MICMKRALTDGVSNMSSTWQYRQMSITCTAYQSQNTILAYSHLQMITGVLLAFGSIYCLLLPIHYSDYLTVFNLCLLCTILVTAQNLTLFWLNLLFLDCMHYSGDLTLFFLPLA